MQNRLGGAVTLLLHVIFFWSGAAHGQGGVIQNANCLDCDAGKNAAQLGQHTCTVCVRGKYMLVLGSSTQEADCKNCVAGTYSNTEGAVGISVCTNCASGKNTVNEIGRASCRERV